MAAIDSLRFDDDGWTLRDSASSERRYNTPAYETLHIAHVPGSFTPLVKISDPAALRARVAEDLGIKEHSNLGGGVLLDFAATPIAPVGTVTMLSKWRMAREYGLRIQYRGLFVLALPEEFFSFSLRCTELGETTGVREATVSVILLKDPAYRAKMRADSPPPLVIPKGMDYGDWARSQPLVYSPSDGQEWDEKFPDHALSRARRYLRRFRDTAKVVSG